jgi:small subunit ribosomal protein S21
VSSLQITVYDNNIEKALRTLKKKLQREGIYREMRLRRHFEKPCEERKRKDSERLRRHRKMRRMAAADQ